jgi:hypothetical protein
MHFIQSYHDDAANVVGEFDMEIRTHDATQEIDQIVGARAFTRAFPLKGAELSTKGGAILTPEARKMNQSITQPIYRYLNSYRKFELSKEQIVYMKENAKSLLFEMAPYLTNFEIHNIENLIENPVRERGLSGRKQ